jgi:SNF2 family DNA or RNA helicase
MAILHGSWAGGSFWVWGEVWRSVEPIDPRDPHLTAHPLALAPAELVAQVTSIQPNLIGQPIEAILAVPSLLSLPKVSKTAASAKKPKLPTLTPLHSGAIGIDPDASGDMVLWPWQIPAIALDPGQALLFLTSLPLGNPEPWLGGDLRFWAHLARWGSDLICRSRFWPGIEADQARWEVLLDGVIDRQRLVTFARHMPLANRLPGEGIGVDAPCLPRPIAARARLIEILGQMLNQRLHELPLTPPDRLPAVTRAWMGDLMGGQDLAQQPSSDRDRLTANLDRWAAGLRNARQFRGALRLVPPAAGVPVKAPVWRLDYGIGADDDPSLFIDAAIVWAEPLATLSWQGRSIAAPQEALLEGLGRATQLYPILEPSLDAPAPTGCDLTPVQAYQFIKLVVRRLEDAGLSIQLPESLRGTQIANRLGLKINAQLPNQGNNKGVGLQQLLHFRWELTIGGQTLSKVEFERLAAQEIPLVEINGEWVELRGSDIEAAREFFADRKTQPTLSLEDLLRISSGDTQTLSKLPIVDFESSGALQELVTTLTGNRAIEPIIPTTLQGTLRPYQERGVGWLAFLSQWSLGACLADDMGLGKSIQLIGLLLHLKEKRELTRPVILVCPTSVLSNWEREVKRFGPSLRRLIHHGDKRSQGEDFSRSIRDVDLVITSYALVHRDLKTLESIAWQGLVLDEAQNIKNADSKQSRAIRQLNPQFRIALTGTPVENRLSELWSIVDFLNPGYLGAKNFFQRRFAIPIERYGDTDSLKTLRGLVQPFILRRLKTDKTIIQDLPEKQEMAVFCGLTEEQANLYQKTVDETLVTIESAEGIQRHGMVLGLLTKLKQICNHPDTFLKPKLIESNTFSDRSAKLQRLDEMLEEVLIEGDRVLIFTQFAEWGKLLQAHLAAWSKQDVLFLYGSTSRGDRDKMVDRFQQDPQGPQILILSLKAGGVGLNLTRANHVFHIDRWWNPAVENQATDRAFRIGQTRNVQVHKFVCSGTLEERIHDMIESKKALADQVVGAGEDWLTELDTNQLRDLLLLDRSAVIGAGD